MEEDSLVRLHTIERALVKVMPIPTQLTDADPLTVRAKQEWDRRFGAMTNYDGRLVESYTEMDIRVSRPLIGRALLFFDTLVKVLRVLGYTFRREDNRSYACLDGADVELRLKEKEKKERNITRRHIRTVSVPVGKLSFKCAAKHYGSDRREFTDNGSRIEGRIRDIVIAIDQAATKEQAFLVCARRTAAAMERQREEERQQRAGREKEAAKEVALLGDVQRFHMAMLIRSYTNAVQADALVNDRMNSELDQWLSWARKVADGYDPFR